MIAAGLTGGIATGKSTVAAFFKEAGAKIIDTDLIARQAVEKGSAAWRRIVDHFGERILLPGGQLDRGALGDIIFKDAAQRRVLNAIVHPLVREQVDKRLADIETKAPTAVIIVDVPLLIEARMQEGMAEIIVVYAPEAVQLQRLMARNHLGRAAAAARIRSQMPIEEKKARATIVIDNSGPLSRTRRQTEKVYADLKRRSLEA